MCGKVALESLLLGTTHHKCILRCACVEEHRMQCNIDSRGKAYRLMLGLIMAIVGAGLIVLDQLASLGRDWSLYSGIALLAAGAFGIFEGWAGWCVVRALGFKTRM